MVVSFVLVFLKFRGIVLKVIEDVLIWKMKFVWSINLFFLVLELEFVLESVEGFIFGFIVMKSVFLWKSGFKLIIVFLLENIEVNYGDNIIF